MWNQLYSFWAGNFFGFSPILFAVLLVWSIIWKGIALWRSGRNAQLAWFIILLIVNTIGILEIIYLAFFQKRGAWCCKKGRR